MRRPGTKYVGVDLDNAVYDQLNTNAQTDRRPLASLIRVILDQWLTVWNAEQVARAADPDDTYVTGRAIMSHPELRGVFGPTKKIVEEKKK